ncbi:dipeptidase PepE [Capnocytophaga canimorsus]|uniref:dipeptidase PepE n=1 Tax=Capnocytophaga canimorsus TaxID=28188 RepID=UPI00385D2C95
MEHSKRKLLIASTSTIYGGKYLEYLHQEMGDFFQGINTVLFVPFARPSGISHDAYTEIAQNGFKAIGKKVIGLHTFADPIAAIEQAEAIFVGGGNTFLLVKQLYEFDVMKALRQAIDLGTPYMGSSAGSNIVGQTMQTTNDMPIVYPPSFKTLGVLPFNLNPHYLDPQPELKHMGETREIRIKEFLQQSDLSVVGLREGSWLRVIGEEILLKGGLTARIFSKNQAPYEHPCGVLNL